MLRVGYVVASLIGLAMVATLGAGALTTSEPMSSPASTMVGQASDRYPSETLTDWVSYADQVSTVTAVAEEELPAPPEVHRHGEGYLPRAVTLRIEETVWQRAAAPSVAGTVRVVDEGWVLRSGQRHQFTLAGAIRLTVGERYLVPLVLTPEGAWAVLSPRSKLELHPDQTAHVAIGETELAIGHPSAASALDGMTTVQIAAALDGTVPDPAAAEYAHLDPDARHDAAVRERHQ